MYDHWGRRFFTAASGFFCFVWLALIAELGDSGIRTTAAVNTVIAAVIFTSTFSRWTVANAFVIGSEIGGLKMRKKLMALGGFVNMICAILVTSITVSQPCGRCLPTR